MPKTKHEHDEGIRYHESMIKAARARMSDDGIDSKVLAKTLAHHETQLKKKKKARAEAHPSRLGKMKKRWATKRRTSLRPDHREFVYRD